MNSGFSKNRSYKQTKKKKKKKKKDSGYDSNSHPKVGVVMSERIVFVGEHEYVSLCFAPLFLVFSFKKFENI